MNKFENPFIRRTDGFVDSPSDPGPKIQKSYDLVEELYVEDGIAKKRDKVICLSEINLDKEIQQNAKGTTLREIIQKFVQTGDESLLNVNKGVYADISNMPSDLIQAKQIADRINILKSKYNLSDEFVEKIGSMNESELKDLLKKLTLKAEPTPKPEPTKEIENE